MALMKAITPIVDEWNGKVQGIGDVFDYPNPEALIAIGAAEYAQTEQEVVLKAKKDEVAKNTIPGTVSKPE